MTVGVHVVLRERRQRIVAAWEALVGASSADERGGIPALRELVPPLLDALAAALEGGARPGDARGDGVSAVLSRLHPGADLAQVLREHRLLREAILRELLAPAGAADDARGALAGEVARLNAGLDVALSDWIVRAVGERQGRPADPALRPRPSPAEAGGGHDVLVAEHDAGAAATLAGLLTSSGHRVSRVATGAAAVDAVAANPPDVLVCDLELPDLSGHEVIRAIRAREGGREAGSRVFALALTGRAQPEDGEAAIAAGFDAHLPKPPSTEALQALLARAAPP